MTHAGGRPSLYSDALVKKAEHYLKVLPRGEIIHSIEGLADYLGVIRATIYDWASQEEKPEFSYIVEQLRHLQAKELINKGLSGAYNSSITKVILSKHGYREATETDITTKGDKLMGDNVLELAAKAAALLKEEKL